MQTSVHQTIIILDFGGQYNQLIARRVREEHVYCEVLPFDTPLVTIQAKNPVGIMLTGGPSVVTDDQAPTVDPALFELGIPVLGICYGCQLMAHLLGGQVTKAAQREYGQRQLNLIDSAATLVKNIDQSSSCWMSHTYYVSQPPTDFKILAATETCPTAIIADEAKQLYGVQFHPEVTHTQFGQQLLHNFLVEICGCTGDWTMKNVAAEIITQLKEQLGDQQALCALSGGVDSTVAAVLVHRAIGDRLHCVLVDHGLMRLNEITEIRATFAQPEFKINLTTVDASQQFLTKLADVTDPERKRQIVGEEFIRVFEAQGRQIGQVDFLVQGTIYPDVIESGTKNARTIKSHHNVGGLPDVIDFKAIVEPLRNLFKDEVRALGQELGLPEEIVWRQPFPGPGLAIRIIGAIDQEKLDILRQADAIFRQEIFAADLHRQVNQYFAVLTNLKTVGVMGDERTYDYVVALRAVETTDFMTADWAPLPQELLAKVSQRIVNEVEHVNRIVYDITSKPPGTIEWE